MSRYDLQILERLQPDWRQEDVDVVTFPAPPVPAKGHLYAEDCWRSNALEVATNMLRDKGKTVLGALFTNRGPAFLMRQQLGDLLGHSGGVVSPIYCATISFATLTESEGVVYATEALLEGMMSIMHSCHPGSHTCVPSAPLLTALIQTSYALDGRDLPSEFRFADHDMGSRYFPKHDFSANAFVDGAFRYLTIQDCVGSASQIKVHPVLTRRVIETLNTVLLPNGHFKAKYPDVGQYIAVVDQFRNQLTCKGA